MIFPSFFEWLAQAFGLRIATWLSELSETLQFAILVLLLSYFITRIPGKKRMILTMIIVYILLAYGFIDATIWRTGTQPSASGYTLVFVFAVVVTFVTWSHWDSEHP